MQAIMTEQGLLIPKEELAWLGTVVLEKRGRQIVIRPQSMVEATCGIVASNAAVTDKLLEEIELGGMWDDHGREAE